MSLNTQDGRLIVLSGASRSGKTAYAAKNFAKAPRAMAWDPEGQWGKLPGWQQVTTAAELVRLVGKGGNGRYAYCPNGDMQKNFDFFCKCLFLAVDKYGPLVGVLEELADVTSPGKAPPNWGICVRRGLKRGLTMVPISQRWAEADKTAFGNASKYVIFRQSSADDTKYLARKTRVPANVIDGLMPLEFVEYDALTQTFSPGKLKFS